MGVFNESLLSTEEAAALAKVHPETIRRWYKAGIFGVKLEGAFRGSRFVTSKEAITRFYAATNATKNAAC